MEESYLLEYIEYESKTWTHCTSGLYIQPLQVSAPDPYPVSRYSEYTKTNSFSILGFFRPEVKLGFDFPRVSPNQKYQPRSLNFNFYEDKNPMTSSLKNSSSIKSPNLLHQKLEMHRIKFYFNKKMRPSMKIYTSLIFLMIYG